MWYKLRQPSPSNQNQPRVIRHANQIQAHSEGVPVVRYKTIVIMLRVIRRSGAGTDERFGQRQHIRTRIGEFQVQVPGRGLEANTQSTRSRVCTARRGPRKCSDMHERGQRGKAGRVKMKNSNEDVRQRFEAFFKHVSLYHGPVVGGVSPAAFGMQSTQLANHTPNAPHGSSAHSRSEVTEAPLSDATKKS